MKVQISKQYRYSPDGNTILTVELGEQELSERWAKKAIASGHATAADAPASNKAKPSSKRQTKAAK